MPILEVHTNVAREKVTPGVLSGLSKMVSEMLGISESYCMMHVLPDQLMSFGGSSEPCASVRLSSIGRLGVELNKTYAAKIFVFMEKHLGISNDRMFIVFQDLNTSTVGHKGTTFHELYGR
ncbi:macrophage migration inhibitory factor-like [Portunus trituberculatus]|uniref:macrophage migration inhibitory factor-like n=1 Tax=Portunus trituberculatus TaxID=210409 RepID=UPI001E1CE03B|nr:macrophage migration inhibitory factor-like [Portunus trituberculatus]